MTMGIEEDLIRIKKTGTDAFSHFVCITQVHTLLLQLELKERLWLLVRVFVITLVIAIALGGALLCGSFALAFAIHQQWPSLGTPLALIIVALLDIALSTLLLLCVHQQLKRLLSLRIDALQSWMTCISNIFRTLTQPAKSDI
jgi:hypothetical protein